MNEEDEKIVVRPWEEPRAEARIAFRAVNWPRGAFPAVEAKLAALGVFTVNVEYPAGAGREEVVVAARDILAERLIARKILRRPVTRPSDGKVIRIEWLELVEEGGRTDDKG